MGDHKALTHAETIEKMKSIAKDETAMFCTFAGPQDMKSRPMATVAVDDDGTFWFVSQKDSFKNQEVKDNAKVQLLYTLHSRSEYLAIDGTAMIVRDQKKLDELWSIFAKAYFPAGPRDENVTLIKVTPTGGYYWDTSHGKMVHLALMLAAAITGKPKDDGIQGALRV